MTEQTVFTTGEAAKICKVSQRTVIRWIDSGRLNGHRFPGAGGHRRVLAKDLLAFLRENKIPVPPGMENIRLRVLIVEDEAVVALLMEETLQAEGFETRIATNGFEAGQLLSTFEPDVMTLDLKMPGMPGIEVLETLQSGEGNKNLGILVVSGMPENELNEALAKGADQAISKPFRNEDLLDCIKKLIEAPSRDAGTTVR